jgi:hypothetical protein
MALHQQRFAKPPKSRGICRAGDCRRPASETNSLCTPHARQAATGQRFTFPATRTSGRKGPRRPNPVDLGNGTWKVPLVNKHAKRCTLVDAKDLALVRAKRWLADDREQTAYVRCVSRCGKYREYLHRLIMGPPPEPGLTVHHIDGNGLNNTRANLRWATPEEQREFQGQQDAISRHFCC